MRIIGRKFCGIERSLMQARKGNFYLLSIYFNGPPMLSRVTTFCIIPQKNYRADEKLRDFPIVELPGLQPEAV